MRIKVIPQYIARNKRLKDKGYKNYAQYLRSKEWEHIREYLRGLPEFRYCWCCGAMKNLQMHHKTYKLLSKGCKQQKTAIIALCGSCHVNVHNRTKEKNLTLKRGAKSWKRTISKKLNKTVI